MFNLCNRRVTAHRNAPLLGFTLITLGLLALCACNKRLSSPQLVINELMVSNHTCLLTEKGKSPDWIEIKNLSQETVNLKGCSLVLIKDSTATDSTSEATWEFPEREVKAGECVIVFASKKKKKDKDVDIDTKDTKDTKDKKDKNNTADKLRANFKLPSKGATLLLMRDNDTISRVRYGELEDDQCYRRLDNGSYEVSYEATPGFDNTEQGYEQYCAFMEKQRKGPLRLWEMHTRGHKEGKAWVELKNISTEPVNLNEYCLSTSRKDSVKYNLPKVTLKPGAIHLVKCQLPNIELRGRKPVILTKDDAFMDGACAALAPLGTSMGRIDGENGFFLFSTPTPGAENSTPHYRRMAPMPTFDTIPGVYPDKKTMKVGLNTHGRTVHYTTDGSEPTDKSPVYSEAIEIDTTTTIRAYCESDSTTMASITATGTYILADHKMPIINISVDPADLYDYYKGIYVEGPGASPEIPHLGANYWKRWWKKAHVEFFDGKDGFSYDCGLAIFGAYSRQSQKKSFKIKFNDDYGPNHIYYDLFDEGVAYKVKNFVLRSGSQDNNRAMVRDEFFTSLMQQNSPTLLVQAYRPVALYINGGYFGLYYIREKIDKHFVARHLHVKDDSVSIIFASSVVEEGSGEDYRRLLNYAKSHNMALDEHYQYVKEKIDLTAFIDYKLGQMYSINTDHGNVRFVRSTDASSDKKWHAVFFDLDWTWLNFERGAEPYIRLNCENPIQRMQNVLISALLKNKDFRQLFLERTSLHMHKTFSVENTTSVFDNLINSIKPEMPRNCERWPRLVTYKRWEEHVSNFRSHFSDRNKILLNSLRRYLAVTPEEEQKYFADLGY